LEENSEVVQDIFRLTCVASHIYATACILFVLYSGRKTGPHAKTSRPEESWRFRRSVHRIWLYTSIFPGDRYSLDDIDGLDDAEIDLIQHQRTAMLSEYPTFNSTPSCGSYTMRSMIIVSLFFDSGSSPAHRRTQSTSFFSGAARMGTRLIPTPRGRPRLRVL
jgi:hypothetical protein